VPTTTIATTTTTTTTTIAAVKPVVTLLRAGGTSTSASVNYTVTGDKNIAQHCQQSLVSILQPNIFR
jgi:hypothetical protein